MTWHVNIRKTTKRKDSDGQEILYKSHRTYNYQHQQARARVEMPNGIFETMFQSLANPWMGDEQQQDYLLFIACGIHNVQLK